MRQVGQPVTLKTRNEQGLQVEPRPKHLLQWSKNIWLKVFNKLLKAKCCPVWACEASEDHRWGRGTAEAVAPSYRLFTFMKIFGCSKEDQGNPEQDSHRVLARGGGRQPCQNSTLAHFPYLLVRSNALTYKGEETKMVTEGTVETCYH